MTRATNQGRHSVDRTPDHRTAPQVPAPRFEWAPDAARPLAGVSHVDVSDYETTEIPRIVD